MKRISLYKLIKKYKTYCHVSIFFNNRLSKRIRYGYKFYQKSFKDAKRLKFLKINIRQPRLPIRRKTKYGKILEERQKMIYIIGIDRRAKYLKYISRLHRGNRSGPLNTFLNLSYTNPFLFYYSFGFIENPAFLNFYSRYYESKFPNTQALGAFRSKNFYTFKPDKNYWYYLLATFKFRAFKRLIFYFFSYKNFFLNLSTLSIYPFHTKSSYGSPSKALYGNKNALPRTFLKFF